MFTVAQVHFSLRGHNDLVVQARHKDTNDVLQLVPPDKLKGDLPSFFVEEHVHWLNLSTSVIEIRPLQNCWKQSDEHWRIGNEHGKYHVYKDHQFLVDIRSRTWVMVSGLLECLDPPENLVVTTPPVDFSSTPRRLSVSLPHRSLSFFVNSNGDLESDDFKEMVYDKNQDIGTLFGLNRLVLRAKAEVEEGLVPRYALISPNARNKIPQQIFGQPTTYYVYKVDTELGCLTGNSSWESKYFLAYLHSASSIDWRPDPLTGRTGAQEAFSILCSAGYQSLRRVSEPPYWDPHFRSRYPQIWLAAVGSSTGMGTIATVGRRAKRAAYLFSANDTASKFLRDCSDGEFFPLPSHSIQQVLKYSSISSRTLQTTGVQGVSADHHHAPPSPLTLPHVHEHLSWPTTLGQLLSARDAPALRKPTKFPHYELDGDKHSSPNTPALNRLLSSLRINKGDPPFQEWYITHLHASAEHVHEGSQTTSGRMGEYPIQELKMHFVKCKREYMEALCRLKDSLCATADPLEQAYSRCGGWPHITPYSFLGCLASTSSIELSQDWRKCLVSFALLLLELQHARRLLRFACEGLEEEFIQELENDGCDGWHAEQHPDWLLIQVRSRSLSGQGYLLTAPYAR